MLRRDFETVHDGTRTVVTKLSDQELKIAHDEWRARVLAETARDRCLAIMRANGLPVDSVDEDFMTRCVEGVVDHFVANLSWTGDTLNGQMARAVREVFRPSLTRRYWEELQRIPGEKPDVPDKEFLFGADLANVRRWMSTYAWNRPDGERTHDETE